MPTHRSINARQDADRERADRPDGADLPRRLLRGRRRRQRRHDAGPRSRPSAASRPRTPIRPASPSRARSPRPRPRTRCTGRCGPRLSAEPTARRRSRYRAPTRRAGRSRACEQPRCSSHPTDRRARPYRRRLTRARRATFRGTDDRGHRPVGSRHRAVARRRAACSAPRIASSCAEGVRWSETLDLSISSSAMPTASRTWTSRSKASAAPAASARSRTGLKQMPGVVDARLNFTNRRLAVGWRDDDARRRRGHRRARAHRLSRASVRARARRSRRGAPGALADAMPRRRGLRRDEHHAAVGLGVVRQRHRHDAGDARLLSLALGADRAAGRGLCRPAVLPERAAGAPGAAAQHGRADLARRDCSRSACRWSRPSITPSTPTSIPPIMLLFFLLCGRYLDHAMRRKTRAVAGNLAALKAEVAHRFDASGELVMVPAAALQARRPPAGAAGRARAGRRRCDLAARSEIDESLVTGETARRGGRAPARRSMPAA